MNNFAEAFNRLNPEQLEAVETIDGPVLVVAGPGTGKTQILTLRIANILNKTDALPENILALTFTENAAQNMKERLIEFIGETAYKVKITTFHSFANDIILAFPEKFAFQSEMNQMDDLQKYSIFKSILDNFNPKDTYATFQNFEVTDINNQKLLRPFNAPYLYLYDIIQSIENLKREFITPDKYTELIKIEIDDFLEIKKINPKTEKPYGKWTQAYKKVSKNIELLHIYKSYLEVAKKEGLYDFGDMITFVTEKLKSDDELLAYYQERYLYILVDEYQDTNGAQNEIIKTIGSWDISPNIFAVGDDDQSIFRFQGASLSNILDFKNAYPYTKVIVLKNNYRSTQEILNVSTSLIENNTERLTNKVEGLDKNLIAKNTTLAKGKISLSVLHQEEIEYHYIAQKINELIKNGVSPNEIAVIYHKHKDGNRILDYMEKSEIPTEIVVGNNLVNEEIFKEINLLLNVINHPDNDEDLGKLLLLDIFNLDTVDSYKIFRYLYRKRGEVSLLEVLLDSNVMDKELKITKSMNYKLLAGNILEWQKQSQKGNFEVFIINLLNESGFIPKIKESKDLFNLNNIKTFIEFISSRVNQDKNYTLKKYQADINIIEENNIAIKVRDLNPVSSQGVNMLTAHASKGLEFEHVFLPKIIDKTWGNTREMKKIKLVDLNERRDVINHVSTTEQPEDKNQEERRLFFVSLTRAKSNIYLSRSEEYLNDLDYKKALPSQFIGELDEKLVQILDTSEYDIKQEEILNTYTEPVEIINYSSKEKDYLEGLIKNFKLSASALNAYLNDPQEFLYNYIIRIPQVKAKQLALGTATHAALEYFYRELLDGEQKDLDYMNYIYEKTLEKEYSAYSEYPETLKEGKRILKEWYEFQNGDFIVPQSLEYALYSHNVFLDDIPLVGKIDKIEWINEKDKTVKLIDYKTSTPKSQGQITKPIDGGRESDIYRQLTFYKLATDLDQFFNFQVLQTEIDYLKSKEGKFHKINVEIPQQDVQRLKEIIKEVMQKIRGLKF